MDILQGRAHGLCPSQQVVLEETEASLEEVEVDPWVAHNQDPLSFRGVPRILRVKEKANEPKPVSVTSGPVVPGDKVYIKEFRRKWNTPRRRGPYTVVRATPTSVQVEGSVAWHHLNHCSLAPTTNNCKTGPGDWSDCTAFSNDQSPKRGSIASHASDEDSPVRADSEFPPDDVVVDIPLVSSSGRDRDLGRDNSTNPDPKQQSPRRPITRAFSRKQRGNCATRERPQ
ncbi:uncharacterized protein LOC121654677 [Melanotaenia boesemani]|uniref:uncharacterized protein LOC121654677 n=1 Tax=Melanotaenia boesemani TaxID=1250792 RepID=UPI001C056A7F|nr:uncharacterized protein LOC121654677 [Melanotaenia boesemani]